MKEDAAKTRGPLDILESLIGFATVSRDPNRELLAYVEEWLGRHGVNSQILWNEDRRKGNLWATIGPADRPGVILSGHTDVVPVDGQAWSSDPFAMRRAQDRVYGRGTADMKGFLAVALALVPEMLRRPLKAPVHLALSYDEELGCLGVRSLVSKLADMPVKPALCIIGEPTRMQVVIGHKGGRSYRVRVTGSPAHSSLAPRAVNAIDHAAELILFLRGIATEWRDKGPFDTIFDVPHSTLSTGLIQGGTAINIVPGACEFVFEFRHLASLDVDALVRRIEGFARELEARMRQVNPQTGIEFTPIYEYPGLDMEPEHPAVTLVKQLVERNDHAKVAFGTEAGLFKGRAGIPAIVCGPGSISQAHQPDEFVELAQLEACERMLRRLLDRLESGGFGIG
jgi:acetylornithine deacetylase